MRKVLKTYQDYKNPNNLNLNNDNSNINLQFSELEMNNNIPSSKLKKFNNYQNLLIKQNEKKCDN